MSDNSAVKHRMNIGTTLTNFLVQKQIALAKSGKAKPTGNFTALMLDVATSLKKIADLVKRGALIGIHGVHGGQNVQGEDQKKLTLKKDVLANDLFIESLSANGNCAALVSEELEEIHVFENGSGSPYLIATDPLDGSSNIDVNVSVGAIIGIMRRTVSDLSEPVAEKEFYQPAKSFAASVMCVFGPSVCLFISMGPGSGTHEFVLDQDIGEFILSRQAITIPKMAYEYAINASNRRHWAPSVRQWIEEMEAGKSGGTYDKDFNMRWVASAVADVQRILTRGGVWAYPHDAKLAKEKKAGRIRLLYEVGPMANLIVEAGGAASVLPGDALDFVPSEIHQRVPIVLGSAENVLKFDNLMAEVANKQN